MSWCTVVGWLHVFFSLLKRKKKKRKIWTRLSDPSPRSSSCTDACCTLFILHLDRISVATSQIWRSWSLFTLKNCILQRDSLHSLLSIGPKCWGSELILGFTVFFSSSNHSKNKYCTSVFSHFLHVHGSSAKQAMRWLIFKQAYGIDGMDLNPFDFSFTSSALNQHKDIKPIKQTKGNETCLKRRCEWKRSTEPVSRRHTRSS